MLARQPKNFTVPSNNNNNNKNIRAYAMQIQAEYGFKCKVSQTLLTVSQNTRSAGKGKQRKELPLFLNNASPHLTSDGNSGVRMIEKSRKTSKLVTGSLRKSLVLGIRKITQVCKRGLLLSLSRSSVQPV